MTMIIFTRDAGNVWWFEDAPVYGAARLLPAIVRHHARTAILPDEWEG